MADDTTGASVVIDATGARVESTLSLNVLNQEQFVSHDLSLKP
jgi:hypothetical protein